MEIKQPTLSHLTWGKEESVPFQTFHITDFFLGLLDFDKTQIGRALK